MLANKFKKFQSMIERRVNFKFDCKCVRELG